MTAARSKRTAGKSTAWQPTLKERCVHQQEFVDRIDVHTTAALLEVGLPVRPGAHDAAEVLSNIHHLSRTCASALHTVREQAAEIARLKLMLDASTTGTIDQALSALLAPHNTSRAFGNADVAQHVVVVTRDPGGGLWATLCVARGETVLPYRRPRSGGTTIHVALASLLFDIDPHLDFTGMCDGLRQLHGHGGPVDDPLTAAPYVCRAAADHDGGYCNICGQVP